MAMLLGGCAGDAAGGDGGRPGGRTPGLDLPAGDDGTANDPTPSSTGMFGNSTAPTAPTLPDLPPDAGACQVGVFCENMDPDPDDCGSLTLEAEVEVIENPGNVLLVYDRSGSMSDDWNGQARWETAGQAIEAALTPLADLLTVGSVFFPSSDPNATPVCVDPTGIACIFVPGLLVAPGTCGVNPIASPDQINFVPGPDFINSFSANNGGGAPVFAPIPMGFTPLKEGLMEAQTALASATLTGTTSVVIITDGQPNCEWDAAVSRQIVTDWAAQGIRTYVVGLPGSGGAEQVLNELATAGGTGQYITPADSAGLEQALNTIASETVTAGFDSCEITINPPAEVPDKLHLIVSQAGNESDVPHVYGNGDDAWTVSDDGALVELVGDTCTAALDGVYESIRFEFGCVELPPAEPPVVE